MMNPEDIMLNKRNQTQSGYCRVLLRAPTIVKFIDRKMGWLLTIKVLEMDVVMIAE